MKNWMKKVSVMVLALAMLTGTLTACGAGTAAPSTQQPFIACGIYRYYRFHGY